MGGKPRDFAFVFAWREPGPTGYEPVILTGCVVERDAVNRRNFTVLARCDPRAVSVTNTVQRYVEARVPTGGVIGRGQMSQMMVNVFNRSSEAG